jgi:phosphoenolpyruvate carboxykinase (ATP)
MENPFLDAVEAIESKKDIIRNPSSEELRKLASHEEKTTEFGSASYITKTRSRSAKFTEIVYEPNEEHENILNKVKEYLADKKLIAVDRLMCQRKDYQIKIRAFVTEKYARILYLWGNTLFSPESSVLGSGWKADFNIIDIPEWPEKKILVDPNGFTTFILGSDYMGEVKKAGLRMGMYYHKIKHEGLGLHAGSKILRVWDKEGKMIEKGMVLFGLSATGKTTLTCHHHWLAVSKGEEVRIRQDDVLMMNKDGSAAGTEENFYIKTDGLEPDSQPLLYKGAISPNAILENVFVDEKGKVDFFDSSITSNGRAVVMRRELDYSDDSIDIPKVDMVVFITRRKTIVPPIARLTPEQAAAFFMLGESVESSAGDPTQAGKPIKVVGTNPFIIGPEAEEGNRFLEILKANPGIECYLLDTGSFGQKQNTKGMKISVYDSARLLADAARGVIVWKKDPDWGYEVAVGTGDVDLGIFDPSLYYGEDEYKKLTEELKEERRAWLRKFEGLNKEIVDAI